MKGLGGAEGCKITTVYEHGGDMEIEYIVDFQHAVVGYNLFKINVSEQKKGSV